MAKEKDNQNSWRSLRQTGRNRAVSAGACQRRRSFFVRSVATLFGGIAVLAIIFGGMHLYRTNPELLQVGESRQKLEVLQFDTDGVLTQDWAESVLFIQPGVDYMSLDIVALDHQLEAQGQVLEATVQRIFPNALKISVREHKPVLRMRVADASGKPQDMLVAETGDVFWGHNYPAATLRGLPYLGGVTLKQAGESYARIPGIPVVAELLDTARYSIPEIYSRWQVVMLNDFDGRVDVPWAVIRVRSREMGEIVFRPTEFSRQINRLASILEDVGTRRNVSLRRIDLTFEDRAAVQIARDTSSTSYRR